MSSRPEKLRSVSATHPCQVCGGDHKCSTGSAGLIICGRQAGDVPGFVHIGPSKDPQFHLYRVAEEPSRPKIKKPKATNWAAEAAKFARNIDDSDLGKPKLKLARSLGLPPSVIDQFTDLGVSPHDSEGACWTLPERDGEENIVGINRRFINGKKKAVYGGNRGLTILAGWRDRSGPLLLVEGASDTLALAAAGLAAVGRPNNTGGADYLSTLLAGLPADRQIIVLGENDKKPNGKWPGKEGAQQLAACLSERLGRVIHIAFPPHGEKDSRAWFISRITEPDDDQAWAKAGQQFLGFLAPVPVSPPAPDIAPKFAASDMGNAERLVFRHGKDLKKVAGGPWYVWDGKRWLEDGVCDVVQRAKATVRTIPIEAAESNDPNWRQRLLAHALSSESARSVRAMVDLAGSDPKVVCRINDFDADRWLLNCPNGVVDLRTGELVPHRREDLLTGMCPTNYNPKATCPIWERTLSLIFPADPNDPAAGGNTGLITYLQRLYGICLTGVVEAILPIFWGGGANGKSTVLNAVQKVLGGDYAMQAPRDFLMAKHHESHPTELTDLRGKRVVVATETKKNKRIDESLIKWLTGGERIRARRMREDFYEFDPTHTLILCTNHRPRISEADHGIWRRISLVPFLTQFWDPDDGDALGPPHLKQDKSLRDNLATVEAEGILAWMVRGCLEWQKHGLGTPPEVQQQTAEYKAEEDTVGLFLTECVSVSNANHGDMLKDVYAAYRRWCEETGGHPMSSRALAADLREKGHKLERGHANQVVCPGIRVTKSSNSSTGSLADYDD